jgi:hypothetical protein
MQRICESARNFNPHQNGAKRLSDRLNLQEGWWGSRLDAKKNSEGKELFSGSQSFKAKARWGPSWKPIHNVRSITMRISDFSSSLRRRAAHDAPPVTPPTMMAFVFFAFNFDNCFFELNNRSSFEFRATQHRSGSELLHEPSVSDDEGLAGHRIGRERGAE